MLRSICRSLQKVRALRQGSLQGHGRGHQVSSVVTLGRFLPISSQSLHTSVSRLAESHESIDVSLLRLDQEIRRTGRVARREIDELLQDIRDMKKATSNQSLMMIRCCGDLVPSETPENRTKLVQEVWKTMETLNVPFDISHYNALLRVYLENEFKFNPTEFLQELSNKGFEPNRVTYQRLIAHYCQEGDIDGATTILQFMKEKQLPINEHVFNALVEGHAKADDMESAEGMIAVMKQSGLEPNDDTYVTLLCGYARKGDMDNFNRIIQECKDKEVHLIDRDFMHVIFTMSTNGHEALVESVLPMLTKQTGFNQDATNLILRLVSNGKVEIAYRILKEMSKIVRNDEVLPSGNFFVQQLVKCLPSEEIIKYCKMMVDEGINPYALSKACDIALQTGQFDKSYDLLEAYKESGAPLRQHYFWPLFALSSEEKHVFGALKSMKYLEIPPNTETLRDYVIPALFQKSKAPVEQMLEKLGSYTGIPLSVLAPAAMQHLISGRNIQQAVNFAGKYRLRFSNVSLRKSVVDMYFKDRNAVNFVQIVGSAGLDGEDKGREAVGQIIMDILDRTRDKADMVLPIFKELLNCGIGLSNSGAELIQNALGDELNAELANLILQLTSGDLTPKLDIYDSAPMKRNVGGQLEEKSVTELETMLEEAARNNKPTKGLKKALLFSYCKQKNFEKADRIRQELAADGFVFPYGLQALLLDLYSQFDKLEEARSMYQSLKAALDSPIDDIKILHYAGLLASHDLMDECISVIESAPRDEARRPFGGHQQMAGWKILNSVAEKGQVENTLKLFECLRSRNLIHVNNVTLGPLVKAYIIKDDMEGALKEFERCVREHHVTPWKQDLFCRFIKAEDTDRLQKIIDLSSTLHGEVNTMYDLVFAFIQCGKLRQAKKILETPGLRARNDKIELTCQKYLEENRTGELENLIQITKDLVHLDRSTMYFYLLQAYCKSDDADKALSVWTSLQEESIQPSTELLTYLADFLRKRNLPVPFARPEVPEPLMEAPKTRSGRQDESSEANKTNPLIRKFRQHIEANEIDSALQMKQRLDGSSSSDKLSLADVSLLIDKMARAERLGEATKLTEDMLDRGLHPYPRVLRFMLGRLATAGEVDVLQRFENKLTPELKRQTMFNTRLCVGYTNCGRGREYFDQYIKKALESDVVSSIPLAGSTYILIRHEELLADYEECAKKAEAKGNLAIHNSLWNFYLIKKNFEKARELWSGKLKSEPRLLFRSVMVESKVKQDEDIAKELASQIDASDNISTVAKASACSCVVDVLCTKGKVDEALAYLKTNLDKFQINEFPRESLINLKESLERESKKFPYEIPKPKDRGGRRQAAESSDSD